MIKVRGFMWNVTQLNGSHNPPPPTSISISNENLTINIPHLLMKDLQIDKTFTYI